MVDLHWRLQTHKLRSGRGGTPPPSRSGKEKRLKNCACSVSSRSHCVRYPDMIDHMATRRPPSKARSSGTASAPAAKAKATAPAVSVTPGGPEPAADTPTGAAKKGRGKGVVNWDDKQITGLSSALLLALVRKQLIHAVSQLCWMKLSVSNQSVLICGKRWPKTPLKKPI